jgi:hypothetical protein
MDPKGCAMENLLRGLSTLGPTISEIFGQVGELDKRVSALSATVAANADHTAVVDKRVSALSATVAAKADQTAVDEILRDIKNSRQATPEWKEDLTVELKKMIKDLESKTKQKIQDTDALVSGLSKDYVKMMAFAPSIESFTEFTKSVENISKEFQCLKEKNEQMRDSLAGKLDRGNVPCIDDFDNKGILMKTNRVEVPTFDKVNLLMQSQTEEMEQTTKKMQVRLGRDVDELRQAIAGKAEKGLTASAEQVQDISDSLNKVDKDLQKLRSSVGDTGTKDATEHEKMLGKLLEAVEMLKKVKADEKSTQEQFRGVKEQVQGINQILLPVARAVRSLPAVPSAVAPGAS